MASAHLDERFKTQLDNLMLLENKELRNNVAQLVAQNQELLKLEMEMRRQIQARQALQVARSRPTRRMTYLIRRARRLCLRF